MILLQSWIRDHIMVQQEATYRGTISSTEAQYWSAAIVAQESTWLKQLMEDLHQLTGQQVRIFYNNLSSISLAENPIFHARIKHIEVHYHYIREKVLEGEIEMVPNKTDEQIINILTKGLDSAKPSLKKIERRSTWSAGLQQKEVCIEERVEYYIANFQKLLHIS